MNPNAFQATVGIVLLAVAAVILGFLFTIPLIDKIKNNK